LGEQACWTEQGQDHDKEQALLHLHREIDAA
jgi:hypothetical protein